MSTKSDSVVVFSGIEVNWLTYANFLFNHEDQSKYDFIASHDGKKYFLGKKLGSYSWYSVVPIDDLREFSGNDKVRYVRWNLGKISPGYFDVCPKIYFIKQ
jgi:hypothetical protein